MDKIPPEIWDKILGNLLNSRDCSSASKASEVWATVLSRTKSQWLFGQVLPLLLEYLTKSEILQCRQVCRHWTSGVDYFLENNPYHRPAAVTSWPIKNPKTDFRRQTFTGIMRQKHLQYHNFYQPHLIESKLLEEAQTHSRCPIVGRSVYISTSPQAQIKLQNTQFLESFGEHIWFLFISIQDYPPVDTIQRILELLKFVPDLKKLTVKSVLRKPANENDCTELPSDFLDKSELKNLPKLETLEFCACDPEIKRSLLQILCNQNLQTLSMSLKRSLCNLETRNVVNLWLTCDCEQRLPHLLHLSSPIQRLSIDIRDRVCMTTLFNAVGHFKGTLRELEISLPPNYYSFPAFSKEEWVNRLEPFNDKGIFTGFPNLKRVTLKRFHPLSLNFMAGLTPTLEYLHFVMQDFSQWRSLTEPVIDLMEKEESLDLLEYLKVCPRSSEKARIYESMVWKVLGRLKVLTVWWKDNFCDEVEYRRDVYEKLQNLKLAGQQVLGDGNSSLM